MNNKRQITVSAPGKLMLLGEHAVVYGHPCIVTAVDQRLYLTAELTDKPFFELNAPDVGVKNYKKRLPKVGRGEIPKGAKFVELAIANFFKKFPVIPAKVGIHITTKSDFSSQFGFGSSSASTVCTIFALSQLFKVSLNQKQLFDLSYKTVLDIQDKGSGFDVAAAVWGGTIYFLTGGKTIKSIELPNYPTTQLIVGYSSVKADTVVLIEKVSGLAQKYPQLVQKTYGLIENLVENAKKVIKNGDFATLGELFNINQGYLASLGVSTQKLEDMIYAAREAGAYGAKLSGAGGGDCIVALSPPSKVKQIENAITRAGGKIIKVTTNAQGVRNENSAGGTSGRVPASAQS